MRCRSARPWRVLLGASFFALGAMGTACSVVVSTDGLASDVAGSESAGKHADASAASAKDGATLGHPSSPPPPPADEDAAQPTNVDASVPPAPNDSAPPSACSQNKARVFVTQSMYSANIGGVSGADARCQSSADARGLGGRWRAWLSDSVTPAPNHIYQSSGPYVLLDGTVIAASFAALVSGTLLHPIDRNEANAHVADGNSEVWTGIDLVTQAGSGFCASGAGDWSTSDIAGSTPLVGHLDVTDGTWTAAYLQNCDRTNVRLYCFEACK